MPLPGIRLLWVLLSFILLNGSIARSWSQPPAAGAQKNAQQPAPPTLEQQELDRLFDDGRKAAARGEGPEALKAFELGLEKAQALGDDRRTARFLNRLGVVYHSQSQFDQALDYLGRALTLREKLGNSQDVAESLNNLGNVYKDMGLSEKALRHHQRALALREKLGNPLEITMSLNNLGAVYDSAGQFENALDYLKRALTIREKLGDAQKIAVSLNNLGSVYYSLGLFEKAIEYHNRALEKMGNPQDIAASLNNLGSDYYSQGQSEKALECHNRALALWEKQGNPQDIAMGLSNLGGDYYSLGQYEKALDYLDQAKTQREKMGNPQELAMSLDHLGAVYADLGQFEKSLKCHHQALTLREKLGNPQDIAESFNNLGAVYADLGQFDKALDYYNQALALNEKLGNERDIAQSLANLGGVYDSLGQVEKAIKYSNRALNLFDKLGNEHDIAQSLANLGHAYQKQQQFAKADQAFANALKHFERAEEQITDPTQIGAFQKTLPHFYAAYALLRFQRHLPFDALALADSGRAQGLARQAAQSHTDLSQLFSDEDAQHWRDTNEEDTTAYSLLHAAQQRLDQANHQTDPQEKAAAQTQLVNARARAEQAERQLTLLRSDLSQRYPRFQQREGGTPLDTKKLQHLASQHPDTLFLHYDTVDDKTTLLFALSSTDGLHTFTLPVGDKALSTEAKEWRTALTAPAQLSDPNLSLVQRAALSPQVHRQMQEEPAAASMLYNALILPLDKAGLLRSDRYRHLVVVADGPLLDIPFAALRDQQGRRLIDRFPVAMSVSLGFLAWPTEQRTAQGSLFFAADPTGPKGQRLANQDGRLHLMGGGFDPLPRAREGAQQVAQLFPGASGLTGDLARKEEVKRRMEQYALLLFATHGRLDAKNGLRSWLLLAPEAGKSEAEGLLFAQEILGLRLSARLSVLMACQSGLGQVSGGEGLEGLVWAFWAAGCPSVVGSEWEVDEEATARLMVAFHQGLRSGARKDEALRKAIQAVRKDPNWRYPYFWASFAVYGDTSALPESLTTGSRGGPRSVP